MPKRKAVQAKPRTVHRHVVNADNPVPSPVSSRPGAVVDSGSPQPAPNQSVPVAVVDAATPVPAPVQSSSVGPLPTEYNIPPWLDLNPELPSIPVKDEDDAEA